MDTLNFNKLSSYIVLNLKNMIILSCEKTVIKKH